MLSNESLLSVNLSNEDDIGKDNGPLSLFIFRILLRKNKEFNLKFSFDLLHSDCNIFHIRRCISCNTTMASLKHSIFQKLSILQFSFSRL